MESPRVLLPDVQKSGEHPLVPPQVIAVIGPELSGKSRQGEILSERTHLPLIKMGEIFREVYKEDSELGKRAKESMGKYASDALFREVLIWGVQKDREKYGSGFIIEGAPRTKDQFEAFEDTVRIVSGDIMPIKFIFLNVTRAHAYKRQESRPPRPDDYLLESRLSEHYNELADKVRVAKNYAEVFEVVPTVQRAKTGEVVGDRSLQDISDDIISKLGIDRSRIRSYFEASLTDEYRKSMDLHFADVGHDIATLRKGERRTAILAYMQNLNETFSGTFSTDDYYKSLLDLDNYLKLKLSEEL